MKKLRLSALAVSAALIALSPAAAQASFQPIEGYNVLEAIYSTVGAQGQAGGQYSGLRNTIPSIFRSIDQKDYFGAAGTLAITVLGEMGIISPNQAAQITAIGGNPIPDSDRTAGAMRERHKFSTGIEQQFSQRLGQMIFGEQGQQVMSAQREGINTSNDIVLSGIQGSATAVQESQTLAQQAASKASQIRVISKKLQGAASTHDVMKGIAEQNGFKAELDEAISKQMQELSTGELKTAEVSAANNSILSTLADQGQTGQVLEAAQNETQTRIRHELNMANEYNKDKETRALKEHQSSKENIFIPGMGKPEPHDYSNIIPPPTE